MFTLEQLHERINGRSAELEIVRMRLKDDFFGIDTVIDKVINSIKTWYTFPEFMNRPTIINLWGLTGVGKTALVRNLSKYLNFGDAFVEVQMSSSKSSYYSYSISSELSDANIDPKTPAVLLLDEFQRYRTIMDDGSENNDETYKDVWALLSDGKFYNKSDIKEDIINILIGLSTREDEEEDKPAKSGRSVPRGVPGKAVASKPAGKRLKLTKQRKAANKKAAEEASAEAQRTLMGNLNAVNKRSKLTSKPTAIKRSMWEAKRIKNLLKAEETVMDLMMMSNREIMERCQNALRDDSIYEGDSYNKLLIFISGNLDEVYSDLCNETAEASIDADIFNEQSKRLTFLDVKEQLLKRFKPEQISRMGNNHIIYPSLGRDTFVKIINRKIQEALDDVSGIAPIKITYDDTVVEHIYNNSVFPTQGTRPVFSGIQMIFVSKLPDILALCVEHGAAEARLSVKEKLFELYGTGELVLNVCMPGVAKEYSLPVEAPIVEIKQGLSADAKLCVAVHEAGHAVVFAKLFGKAPIQTVLNMSGDASGKVLMSSIREEVRTLDHIEKLAKVMYAGLIAERLVFPSVGNTTGGTADITHVTSLIASLFRRTCVGKDGCGAPVPRPCNPWADEDAANFVMDSAYFDDDIQKKCEKLYAESREIVEKNMKAIRSLALKLSDAESMNSQEVCSILIENGIPCTPMEKSESIKIPDYTYLFNDLGVFKQSKQGWFSRLKAKLF